MCVFYIGGATGRKHVNIFKSPVELSKTNLKPYNKTKKSVINSTGALSAVNELQVYPIDQDKASSFAAGASPTL